MNARTPITGTLLILAACATFAQAPSQSAPPGLGGTSWQLVKFQGSDDKTLTPADRGKYTIAFAADGRVAVRIDCNRGSGSWTSSGAGQVQVGPLALTRAFCQPAPLTDRLAKDWDLVRSYVFKDNHLFLSLMADGGIYEFEPFSVAIPKSLMTSTGPILYECTRTDGGASPLSATFYKTEPGMVLVEHEGRARPAFSVRAASGTKYEGQDVMFWEAHGEATVTWSGVDLRCRRYRRQDPG
jgi:heat shock protein HslJ/membrane-bound inhibitor of C-type lysozyme